MEHLEPKTAHRYLKEHPDALFVDCRSEMEYMFVGHPIGAMMIPWYDGAEWELNTHFVGQVKKLAGANFEKRPIVLICRSGNRTIEAGEALERAGFKHVINVVHGFEGRAGREPPPQLAQRLARRRAAVGAVLKPPSSLAWTVWALGAALYLIAFYQRVAPAVMTADLSRDFGLSATSLGNLSAFYYYGYVAIQIPTGLLADRWGPRRVLAAGAALTAAGTLLFALSPSLGFANAGRFDLRRLGGCGFRRDDEARQPLDARAAIRARDGAGAFHRDARRDRGGRAAARGGGRFRMARRDGSERGGHCARGGGDLARRARRSPRTRL
jgi:rhodanese-related sulfurtransferase